MPFSIHHNRRFGGLGLCWHVAKAAGVQPCLVGPVIPSFTKALLLVTPNVALGRLAGISGIRAAPFLCRTPQEALVVVGLVIVGAAAEARAFAARCVPLIIIGASRSAGIWSAPRQFFSRPLRCRRR